MKWWELMWLLHEEPTAFRKLLDAPKWEKYRVWFENFREDVLSQRRAIPDETVPEELCREALPLSVWRYIVLFGQLRGGWRVGLDAAERWFLNLFMLNAFHVYRRYGAAAAVDAVDKGVVILPK